MKVHNSFEQTDKFYKWKITECTLIQWFHILCKAEQCQNLSEIVLWLCVTEKAGFCMAAKIWLVSVRQLGVGGCRQQVCISLEVKSGR